MVVVVFVVLLFSSIMSYIYIVEMSMELLELFFSLFCFVFTLLFYYCCFVFTLYIYITIQKIVVMFRN